MTEKVELDKLDKKILFDLLGELGEHFGNSGCTDWCHPKKWSKKTIAEFDKRVFDELGYSADAEEREYGVAMDRMVLDYIDSKLRKALKYR